MKRAGKLLGALAGVLLVGSVCFSDTMVAQAAKGDLCLDSLSEGVASVLQPEYLSASDLIQETAQSLNLDLLFDFSEEEESSLVMANIKGTLNIRSGPGEQYERVGILYKHCGGVILERKDGWTKLQSGNVIGWCSDQYLLFGKEAEALANDVGKLLATVNTESLRVRKETSMDAEVLRLLPQGEMVEVTEDGDEWLQIVYDGQTGYIAKEFAILNFKIGTGETLEEIRNRQAVEAEKARHKKYSAVDTDEDTIKLLAALIHCEAGGEPYEGQMAVGAVVMNRVRSKAFPNSISGVIYSPGQFTPAMTGKLDRLLESGKIYESCYKAAKEALSGNSNVGDRLFFRRNNGRDGLVIGNHVFY